MKIMNETIAGVSFVKAVDLESFKLYNYSIYKFVSPVLFFLRLFLMTARGRGFVISSRASNLGQSAPRVCDCLTGLCV